MVRRMVPRVVWYSKKRDFLGGMLYLYRPMAIEPAAIALAKRFRRVLDRDK